MLRTRLVTWLLLGAVLSVVVVAAVDALRSSGGERTASRASTSPPTTQHVRSVAARCLRRDIKVSIEVRDDWRHRRVATLVGRYLGSSHCDQQVLPFKLTIRDSAGTRLGEWKGTLTNGGPVSTGIEWAFALPDVWRCDRSGPYLAVAHVGPYSAQRGNLSRSAITC